MKRDKAGPILEKRIESQQWELYTSFLQAPSVRIAELLLKRFLEAEPKDRLDDLGTQAIRKWQDLPKSFSDESPQAEVEQLEIPFEGTKTGTIATGSLLFHNGELWLSSERLL